MTSLPDLQATIDVAWEHRAKLDPTNAPELRTTVEQVIKELNAGRIRVAERQGVGQWTVNQWVKKAVLLSFRLNEKCEIVPHGSAGAPAYDKVPSKFSGWSDTRFAEAGFRVVPGAVARRGCHIGRGVVVTDALRVFTIRTLVAAKASAANKRIVGDILRERRSAFLSTDFIF